MSTDARRQARPTTGDPSGAQATHTVEVDVRGALGVAEQDCAAAMVGAVLVHHDLAADGARVRLSGPACGTGPALVQVNLRVCGAPVRVQVAGRSVGAAIAAGAARLERQIHRLIRGGPPWPWPDPQRRPLSGPGVGRIVRLKTFRSHVAVACQATAAMHAMDYDVHLFTDAETGEDAIVYRCGPTGVRLARQQTMRPPTTPAALPLTVNPRKTPVLTPDTAGRRLAEGWLPFLFFTDATSGRGSVVYRRYDGDLGLIRLAPPAGLQLGRLLPV